MIASLNIGFGEFSAGLVPLLERVKSQTDSERVAASSRFCFFSSDGNALMLTEEGGLCQTFFKVDGKVDEQKLVATFAKYISAAYASLININTPDYVTRNEILLNIFLAPADNTTKDVFRLFMQAVRSISETEGLVLRSSLFAFLDTFDPVESVQKQAEKEPVRKANIADYFKQILNEEEGKRFLHSIYLIDDRNETGLSLSLDSESLAYVVYEFISINMQHGARIFNLPVEGTLLKTFGISNLHYDRTRLFRFIDNYILGKILERENLNKDSIDLAWLVNEVYLVLKDKQNLFEDFYRENINEKENHNLIKAKLSGQINAFLSRYTSDVKAFIATHGDDLFTKKALLATILGENEEVITGNLNVDNRLSVADSEHGIAKIFFESMKDYVDVYPQMKTIANQIIESENYIDLKNRQLEGINAGDFDDTPVKVTFDGGIFSVDGKQINANSYVKSATVFTDKIYQPKTQRNLPREVDLRKYFGPVKDQSDLPACALFPLTAIYEYLAKKNNKTSVLMSEMFLYYEARAIAGEQDKKTGVSLSDSLTVLSQTGICPDELCPYKPDRFAEKPSQAAYDKAKESILEEVQMVNANEMDIKSALNDGLPVFVALKIYKSFHNASIDGSGFVPFPTDEELASNECGDHTMLIVGYNEEDKLFILRNSWGNNFGDNGYCYLPYDYITDKKLTSDLCVLSGIVNLKYQPAGQSASTSAKSLFSSTEARILGLIIANRIRYEKRYLKKLREEYDSLNTRYQNDLQFLLRKPNRQNIITAKIEDLNARIAEKSLRIGAVEGEKNELIGLLNNPIACLKHYLPGRRGWLMALAVTLYSIFNWLILTRILGESLYWLLPLVIAFFVCVWLWYNRSLRGEIRDKNEELEELQVSRDRLQKDIDFLDLKFVIAGELLEKFNELKKNLLDYYKQIKAFFANAQVWQQEAIDEQETSTFHIHPLLNSVIDKQKLVQFLNENTPSHIGKLTGIYRYFSNSKGKSSIIEDIKALRNILPNVKDFDLVKYLLGAKFDILPDCRDFSVVIKAMKDKAFPFMQRNTPHRSQKLSFVFYPGSTDKSDVNQFEQQLKMQYQAGTPMPFPIENGHKVVLLDIDISILPENISLFVKDDVL